MMLSRLTQDRVTVVWAALMVATAISWLLSGGDGVGAEYLSVSIILIAFFKIHLVGSYFMELRDAPRMLHLAFEAWVVGVAAILVMIFVFVR